MRYASWLFPVNRFTILEIKSVNIDNSELKDVYLSFNLVDHSSIQRLKWERQLPKKLSTNILNIYGTFLVLAMELSTTDTSKLHSVNALLDYRATGSFIDYDFIHLKEINTWTISCPISVFNINSSPNEAGQILEVVDIVLCY